MKTITIRKLNKIIEVCLDSQILKLMNIDEQKGYKIALELIKEMVNDIYAPKRWNK